MNSGKKVLPSKRKSMKSRMKSVRAGKALRFFKETGTWGFVERPPDPDPLVDPLQIHSDLKDHVVTPTTRTIARKEVGGLRIGNNSQDPATTAEMLEDEIVIEEFYAPENVEAAPSLPTADIEDLQDLVFTFKNRQQQPSQKELTEWVNSVMLFNKPDVLRCIKMIKLMDGCFIIQLKANENIYYLQNAFIELGKCFNNVRLKQKENWKIARFDIVPGFAWICVNNLPPWVQDEEIRTELSKFGEILKVVNNCVPDINYDILDGNTYVEMQVSRHLPTDLVISGCIARINYCDSPIILQC